MLDASMVECRNKLIAPASVLLRETAMRSSEPLRMACWRDVDWERRVLTLPDAKGGGREVPLSPAALKALHELRKFSPSKPEDPILSISYEALRGAWTRACLRAGINNLKVHDLRRTGATRLALKTGNRFLVKVLTGHKTDAMVDRYVCVTADDVVNAMEDPEVPDSATAVTPNDAINGAVVAPLAPAVSVDMFQDAVALAVQKVLEQMQGAKSAAPTQGGSSQPVEKPCPPTGTAENSHAQGAGLPQELSATQSTSHQAEQGDDAQLHDVGNAAPKSNVVQLLRPPKAQKKAGSVKRGTPSALS